VSGDPRLGGRIKLLRRRAGLTQAQLAERIGRHRNIVVRIESGKTTPGANVAKLIASACHVTIPALYGIEEPDDPGEVLDVIANELTKLAVRVSEQADLILGEIESLQGLVDVARKLR
jgi:transcriptional regulator with XRE-family HTH domain